MAEARWDIVRTMKIIKSGLNRRPTVLLIKKMFRDSIRSRLWTSTKSKVGEISGLLACLRFYLNIRPYPNTVSRCQKVVWWLQFDVDRVSKSVIRGRRIVDHSSARFGTPPPLPQVAQTNKSLLTTRKRTNLLQRVFRKENLNNWSAAEDYVPMSTGSRPRIFWNPRLTHSRLSVQKRVRVEKWER